MDQLAFDDHGSSKFSCNLQVFLPSKSDRYQATYTLNFSNRLEAEKRVEYNSKKKLLPCSGNNHGKQVTLKRNVCILPSILQSPGPAISQKQEDKPAEEITEEKQDTQGKGGILPERGKEAKLKAKYPLRQKPGGSNFMKRLPKGAKYFDSRDHNMAKDKMKNKQLPSAGPHKNLVTGDHIPTAQDLPLRKSSLITSYQTGEEKAGEEGKKSRIPGFTGSQTP
ncbi:alpha-endosulfine-like [Hyaena hyaena]|uniref:alpha-endosulfine-like n=1 Tax=Hyaena hyaena TaxID=95912 RepID=UPI001924C315|nr:alpha-endosulfine-like [Hyaena hyaena]